MYIDYTFKQGVVLLVYRHNVAPTAPVTGKVRGAELRIGPKPLVSILEKASRGAEEIGSTRSSANFEDGASGPGSFNTRQGTLVQVA